jgi:hypothetical protein
MRKNTNFFSFLTNIFSTKIFSKHFTNFFSNTSMFMLALLVVFYNDNHLPIYPYLPTLFYILCPIFFQAIFFILVSLYMYPLFYLISFPLFFTLPCYFVSFFISFYRSSMFFYRSSLFICFYFSLTYTFALLFNRAKK